MTITISFPIFPIQREIAARKRRFARSLTSAARAESRDRDQARYSAEGLEFDVAGIARRPEGSPAQR